MKQYPEGSGYNLTVAILALIGVGSSFGWGWVGLILAIDSLLDYQIRLWHHRRAFSEREKGSA